MKKSLKLCTLILCAALSCVQLWAQKSPLVKQLNVGSKSYEFHELYYILNFKYSGYGTIIYGNPEKTETIKEVQKGEQFKVTGILVNQENGKAFVQIKVSSSGFGYISIPGNPYKNNQFSYKESIIMDGSIVDILSFKDSVCPNEGAEMKALPDSSSETLHEINHKEGGSYFDITEITADFDWVKLTVNGISGWLPVKNVSKEIGGPVIKDPVTYIRWNLIDSNEI